MGVNANPDVDFLVMGAEMGLAAMPWMNGAVQILDPNTGDSDWNEWTNTETGGEPTLLWEGRARIQPLGAANAFSDAVAGFAQPGVKTVRVQVPLDETAGLIRKGLIVKVTNPGNDYVLDGAVMLVLGAVNSSYAWLRTIMCELDVKTPGNEV